MGEAKRRLDAQSQSARNTLGVKADDCQLIAKMWQQYRTTIMAKDAGPTQVHETRMAFYAGICMVWIVVGNAMDGEGDKENNMKVLDQLDVELRKWGENFDSEYMREAMSRIRPQGTA